MKRLIYSVLFVSLFSTSLYAGQGNGGRQGKGLRHVIEQLNLNDEQKDQLKQIRQTSKGQRKILRQAVRAAHEGLDQALETNQSESEIRAAFDALEEKKSAISRFRFEHMMKIRSILTPDQRAEFQRLRPKGKRRRHG